VGLRLQVGPAAGTALTPTPAPAAKEHVKQLLRIDLLRTPGTATEVEGTVTEIKPSIKGAAAIFAGEVGINTGVSELIVHFAPLLVRQDFVGFGHLLELFGCLIIALYPMTQVV
jgi:hypothetical protein